MLVLQVLPGHFQLAFLTQFVIALDGILGGGRVWGVLGIGRLRTAPDGPALSLRGAGGVVLALAAVFPLAALQLWPTARLAQLAAGQRDFEYLSGFASTPFHLVNYVAPGLFHRSPLWRPLVWDPFHAMPEEHLAYVGLVPLFLACTTMVREWRRDASVRLLAILVVVTLVLSLGPYAPGFRSLDHAAWLLILSSSLPLELGHGPGAGIAGGQGIRSLAGMDASGSLAATLRVRRLDLGLGDRGSPGAGSARTARPGWTRVARGFQTAFSAMPWTDDPASSRSRCMRQGSTKPSDWSPEGRG